MLFQLGIEVGRKDRPGKQHFPLNPWDLSSNIECQTYDGSAVKVGHRLQKMCPFKINILYGTSPVPFISYHLI